MRMYLFYLSMNKLYMHTNIEISSFQNGLNHPLSLTGFYFKSEDVKGSHEM